MKTVTLAIILSSTLFGCGSSVHMVRKDVTGGRIALEGAFMPAMGEARLMMAEHCDGRFDAIEHGRQRVDFRCRRRPASAPSMDVASREYAATHGR